MFTYRDFEMGTLGLAWTGDLKNAGGVCEKNGVSFSSSSSTFTKLWKKNRLGAYVKENHADNRNPEFRICTEPGMSFLFLLT